MKRVFLFLILFILLALGGLIVAPGFMDWTPYKEKIQTQIKSLSGYELAVHGDLGLTLLPAPRFVVEDVRVVAPQKGRYKDLISLERLDVNIALMPLFHGEVVIDSIELVSPFVFLEIFEGGKGNWVTPELETLLSQSGEKNNGKIVKSISLNTLSLQGGALHVFKNGMKVPLEFTDMDFDLSAQSLNGPFEAKGSLEAVGQDIALNIKAGALDKEAGLVTLNLEGALSEEGLKFSYDGLVGFSKTFDLQGESAFMLSNLADLPGLKSGKAALKGFVKASPEKISYKNAQITLGKQELSGALELSLSPLKFVADLSAPERFDMDQFLDVSSSSSSKGGMVALPETLSLPVDVNADLKISAPGLIYNREIYGETFLSFVKEGRSFDAALNLKDIPGRGSVDLDASLEFAEVSHSEKSDSFIYSDPRLTLKAKLKTQNMVLSAEEILGISPFPAPGEWKKAELALELQMTPQELRLKKGYLNLGDAGLNLSGVFEPQKEPLALNFDLSSDLSSVSHIFGLDISLVPKALKASSISVKGAGDLEAFSVTAHLKNVMGSLDLDGLVKEPLSDLSLESVGVQVKYRNFSEFLKIFSSDAPHYASWSKPLDFYAKIDKDGDLYSLKSIKGSLAGSSVSGALSVDISGRRPDLQGALSFGDLQMISKSGSKGISKTSSKKKSANRARWSKEPLNTSWMMFFDADLNIKASSILYGPWDLKAPSLAFSLKNGELDIKELSSGLFEGQVSGAGTVRAPAKAGGPLSIDGRAALQNVNIKALTKAMAGSSFVKAKGLVSLDTELKTRGASPAGLIMALGGQGTIMGSDITLEGIDLVRFGRALSDETKPGDTLLGMWKGVAKGGSTVFKTLDGAYNVDKGEVNISKLDLDGNLANVATKGRVDLPRWRVETAHTITLKQRKDVPPFTINISGPLDNPGQTFAQGALNDYLTRKINRKLEKLLIDKLGLPSGKSVPTPAPTPAPAPGSEGSQGETPTQQQPAPRPRQMTPEDAFRGLLEGLIQ